MRWDGFTCTQRRDRFNQYYRCSKNFTTKKSSRGLTFGKFSQHDINKSSKTRSVGVQTEHGKSNCNM